MNQTPSGHPLYVAAKQAKERWQRAQAEYNAAAKEEARVTALILEGEGHGDDYEAKWARAFLAGDMAECRRLSREKYGS